jgi:ketosteroid isomerase-like protein
VSAEKRNVQLLRDGLDAFSRGDLRESLGVEVDRVVFYAFRIQEEQLIYCRAFDDEPSARADLGLVDAA